MVREQSVCQENQIDAMMKRIHSVPIIETLQMEILRLDKGEYEEVMFLVPGSGMEFTRHFTVVYSQQLPIP